MGSFIQIIRPTLREVYHTYKKGGKPLFITSLISVVLTEVISLIVAVSFTLVVDQLHSLNHFADITRAWDWIYQLLSLPEFAGLSFGLHLLLYTLFGIALFRVGGSEGEEEFSFRRIVANVHRSEWNALLLFGLLLCHVQGLFEGVGDQREAYGTVGQSDLLKQVSLTFILPLFLCLLLIVRSREKKPNVQLLWNYKVPIWASLFLLFSLGSIVGEGQRLYFFFSSHVMTIYSEVKGGSDYSGQAPLPEVTPSPVPIEPDSSEPESYRLPKTNQSDIRIVPVDFDLSQKKEPGIFSFTDSLLEDFLLVYFIGLEILFHLVIGALTVPALVVCGIKPLVIAFDREDREHSSVDLPNISAITGE
ncbi:MAG: hypothetical protein AB7H80_06295 [Candidatus Kapaibacterium sp.]